MDEKLKDICYECGKSQPYNTMKDINEVDFDIFCNECLKKKKIQKIKEMLEDDNVTFQEFYEYLQDKNIGNWDRINSEEIIKEYCTEKMNEGVHISHIVKALEENPSEEECYGIWLGNSMETPTPINNKKQLLEELGVE